MSISSRDFETMIAESDQLARDVAEDWTRWRNDMQEFMDRAQELKEQRYATSTRETSNANKGGGGSGWGHSTHLPKIAQIGDNLSSQYKRALFSNRNWLRLEAGQEEDLPVDAESRARVEGYLETKHRLDKFVNKMVKLIDDWIHYGNCFARVDWVNEYHEDPETGKREQGYIGPRVNRISPEDIVFNVMSASFKEAPKIVRSLKTMGTLIRDMEERPELGYSEEAFIKAREWRSNLLSYGNEADLNRQKQLNFDGFNSFTDYLNSGVVEILEYYGDFYDKQADKFYKNHVITVMDKTWVLRFEPLNTWSGKPLIFHAGWRERPDNLWAMGPLDNLVGMQYMINHLRNGIADATDQILSPKWAIFGDVQEPEDVTAPHAIWRSPEANGQVVPLRPDTSFLSADFQIDKLEAQMEAYAGSPSQTMGIRTPGEKTAFEVQQLQDSAQAIFQFRVVQFETSFLEDIVNAELELAKRYLDVKDTISITDEEGVTEIVELTREDLATNGKIIPIGASHFVERSRAISEMQTLIQSLQIDPSVAQHFSSVQMARDIERMLEKEPGTYVEPYVRVTEQVEAQRIQQIAADQALADQEAGIQAQLDSGELDEF